MSSSKDSSELWKPSPRYASFAIALNSKFFLWGGREKKGGKEKKAANAGVYRPVATTLHYFDFCDEKWYYDHLKGLPPPSFMFGSCAQSDHCLYVYGGEKSEEKNSGEKSEEKGDKKNDSSYTGSLFKIDTEKKCFVEISNGNPSSGTVKPMLKNDSGMAVYRGKVILFGGKPDIQELQGFDERTNELHVYNFQRGMNKQNIL